MKIKTKTLSTTVNNTGTFSAFSDGYYIIYAILDQSGSPTYSHFCPYWYNGGTGVQAYYFSTAAASKLGGNRNIDCKIWYHPTKINDTVNYS